MSLSRTLRVILAAALLYGSGAHWLFVQGAAWAGMIAARAERGSFARAMTTTFDGRHPCRACLAVRRHAGAESAPALSRPVPTADFAFSSGAFAPSIVETRAVASVRRSSFESAALAAPFRPPKVLRVA